MSKALAEAIEAQDGKAAFEALPEKRQLWCQEFLKDLNASRATIRAGYKTAHPNKMGTQIKNNEGVKLALSYLQQERQEQMAIDANFVIQKILKSIDRAEAKENEQAVLRGAELLAKHLGMFIEKTEISGPDGDAIRMQQKVQEDVRDFTSAISRLARRGKPGSVSESADNGSESSS